MKGNLKKVILLEGESSPVDVGRDCNGNVGVYRFVEGVREFIKIESVNDIQVGDEVFNDGRSISSFIKTSPIKNVVELADNYIKFETWTSVYELKVEDDEIENKEN